MNLASILIVFLGPFLGFDFPLTLIQLLWVNLVMDTFAALAFGGEPALARYMRERPVSRTQSIISKPLWCSIIFNGLVIALYSIVFLTYDPVLQLFSRDEDPTAQAVQADETHGIAKAETLSELHVQGGPVFLTAFFCFFIFLCTFNAFNVRTSQLDLFSTLRNNKGFAIVIPAIFVTQILFTMWGGSILRTVPLQLNEWIILLCMSSIVIPLDLARKFIVRRHFPAYAFDESERRLRRRRPQHAGVAPQHFDAKQQDIMLRSFDDQQLGGGGGGGGSIGTVERQSLLMTPASHSLHVT
jgi:magnesium-transporting ATPase (P-type)